MLYQAEKLASVGQLAAGMAHEINNPLGFLRSNLSPSRPTSGPSPNSGTPRRSEAAWQDLDLPFIVEDGRDLLAKASSRPDRPHRQRPQELFQREPGEREFTDVNSRLQHVAGVMAAAGRRRAAPGPAAGARHGCLPGHLNQVFSASSRTAHPGRPGSGRSGEVRVSSAAGDDTASPSASTTTGSAWSGAADRPRALLHHRQVGPDRRRPGGWPPPATSSSPQRPHRPSTHAGHHRHLFSRRRNDRLRRPLHRQDRRPQAPASHLTPPQYRLPPGR